MKKLLLIGIVLISILTSCSSQHKLNRSVKKAQRMTIKDFKKGKITVEYPKMNP